MEVKLLRRSNFNASRLLPTSEKQTGFTLIEMMMVIAVLAILAGIALPTYASYITKSKRAEMMVEMQKIAKNISEQKLIFKRYDKIPVSSVLPVSAFPSADEHLYTLTIANLDTGKWKLTATVQPGSKMAGDGNLTLDYKGIKCRDTTCGTGDDWR